MKILMKQQVLIKMMADQEGRENHERRQEINFERTDESRFCFFKKGEVYFSKRVVQSRRINQEDCRESGKIGGDPGQGVKLVKQSQGKEDAGINGKSFK